MKDVTLRCILYCTSKLNLRSNMANEIDTVHILNYEVFDRQIEHFSMMLRVLLEGWEDYSSRKLTSDLKSLCTNASRLCYMADQDLVLQHTDVAKARKEQNENWHQLMEELVVKKFSPFLLQVVNGLREGKMMMGHESPMFSSRLSVIFPLISDLLTMEGMEKEKIQQVQGLVQTLESMVENEPSLSLQPEASLMQPSDSSLADDQLRMEMAVNLFHFLRLFVLNSYFLLHFRRVCHVTSRPLEANAIIRLTESKVQKYISEERGKRSLDLYQARLQYENGGKPLDVDLWLKARRELKAQVPPKFELAFLNYADDVSKAGNELAKIAISAEEFDSWVDVLAKYQLITRRIFEITHPEEQTHSLSNDTFNWMVNGKSVDLRELKKSIAKMVVLVEKKNQWFCVWSVLRHLNLIREGATFATFAHQMMSAGWFGKTEGIVRFTADNLSDYSHYFNEYDYTDWDEEIFLEKKEMYGMTKWSPKLCQNFTKLCERMMKAIWGYSFLV